MKTAEEWETHLKKKEQVEKKKLARFLKSQGTTDQVTLVRYTISAHVAVTTKEKIEEINQATIGSTIRWTYSDGLDGYEFNYQPVEKILNGFHWHKWNDDFFGCFAYSGDFGVVEEQGYIAFEGDVSRFVDKCMDWYEYEWQEVGNFPDNNGIKVISITGQS